MSYYSKIKPGPVEEKYTDILKNLGRAIDDLLNPDKTNKKSCFVLLVCDFNGNRTNFISNGQREDVLMVMKEVIAQAEGRVQKPEEVQ